MHNYSFLALFLHHCRKLSVLGDLDYPLLSKISCFRMSANPAVTQEQGVSSGPHKGGGSSQPAVRSLGSPTGCQAGIQKQTNNPKFSSQKPNPAGLAVFQPNFGGEQPPKTLKMPFFCPFDCPPPQNKELCAEGKKKGPADPPPEGGGEVQLMKSPRPMPNNHGKQQKRLANPNQGATPIHILPFIPNSLGLPYALPGLLSQGDRRQREESI